MQLLKALAPMVCRLSPRTAVVRRMQLLKAESPMAVVVLPRVIWKRRSHP